MAVQGLGYVLTLVTDLARSKKFYGETLGWKLGTDQGNVAGFSFGNAYLVIHAAEGGAGAANSRMHVAVMVDDLEAEHARLEDLGVDVTGMETHPWGERNFSFHDPDGQTWFYSQSMQQG